MKLPLRLLAMASMRNFLDIDQFDQATLRYILDLGLDLKQSWQRGEHPQPFDSKTLVMIFEKPS